MIFGTYWFVAFCCVFYPGYWLFSFSRALRQSWLLLGCFIFHYHFAGPAGVFPIIILSLLTFGAALTRRSPVIILAIGLNVFALCFYKYFHFLSLQVLGHVAPGWGTLVDQGGSAMLPGAPPLAISFFIFELVHYLYDVKNGNLPLRNIAHYASFIFYFPSLVAGPIKRYENFLPELDLGLGSVSGQQVMAGLLRIARGYFLKVVLADFLTGFIGCYDSNLDNLTQLLRWTVFFALGLRIWFDFSGYSDIAIGLAMMMGIKLPENFNWPYAALNIRDFWHRWHISLSSWIRDYVYIPLGGNRVSFPRKILNGIIAFALCGLWHGPAWHFIFWGLYHGIGLALSSNYRVICGKTGETIHGFLEANPFVSWLITYMFVAGGWVFFFYPLHMALHFFYLLVFKLHFGALVIVVIGLACAFVISRRPALWNWTCQLRPQLVLKVELLRPSFLFLGVFIGFSICCFGGRYSQTHPIYKDFLRFHQAINPESAYYPTASQVVTLAESTLPQDKIIVVIGGNSGFLGLKQNADEVWTLELQKILGDKFVVLNLGMPDGSATGIGAVTFDILAKTHPQIIYAFSQIPLGLIPVDGGETYRYFFWQAYYKRLLDFDPDRLGLMEKARSNELWTVDGQELHIGAFVDSYVNADDLWTWVGYQWVWTVWSDKTAATPFTARRLYQDEHDNLEYPLVNPYLKPQTEKPANHKYRDQVIFQGGTIIGDPSVWTPYLITEETVVPAGLRGQTIACLHHFNPWTAYALTQDELAAQDFCYESARQSFANTGYNTMEFGKDYPGEEYADGSHLNATGGRRLARQLAPIILQIAREKNYLKATP